MGGLLSHNKGVLSLSFGGEKGEVSNVGKKRRGHSEISKPVAQLAKWASANLS